jgi:hypothetical protein
MRGMAKLKRSNKELYNEAEAAATLGVSISRLHELLDQYIFTNGSQRPQAIQFTSGDLLLLSYWNNDSRRPASHEVIAMPKRK